MVKDKCNRSPDRGSQMPHRCGFSCLGPMTFHEQAVGSMVRLSKGGRCARRSGNTFKNGVVFISRPVRIQERVRLRVEKDVLSWHGAMRVGFSVVPPAARVLPLPSMAIPNLTDQHGHWAAPVPESFCQQGAQLEFWVTNGGSIYIGSNGREQKVLTGVDISLPLWAMIDVYGQTCCISLMGSEKKELLRTRKSCPVPECVTSPDANTHLSPSLPLLWEGSDDCISSPDDKVQAGEAPRRRCVVCLSSAATVTLPCAHQCLCRSCAPRVLKEFDSCPLCRLSISTGSVRIF